MENINDVKRDEFEAKLIRRAWSEPDFKSRLINDPRAAIQETFGQEINPEIDVVVIDESSNKLGVVIPTPPAASHGGELSEASLEQVAGGGGAKRGISMSSWRKDFRMFRRIDKSSPKTAMYPDTWVPSDSLNKESGTAMYPDTWVP